ncbi:serine/threonine-protein kinase mph1-like [Pomacea canaliculata]|uniref:serine/threonine-protein kinase mph1-like n=1 Tax=Pomacea canaliculata TaxID=400727 RepID=UPI000D73F079|nr:serine/threonine-protein kinase mph1-like [Pomacea canaliculata]XP_025099067.1 serine/threonine-protein kinase mph1-like [Pomacea canaliculata]XP_025099068.1 serine/threonine-protein kinase mph1-like [Pomacea canaliculata]
MCSSKAIRNELDAVDAILDMARSQVQNYAVIVVTAAEIKLMKGDTEKALSILTKALSKGKAQPKDLLIQAIRAAESGQVRLLSEQERKLEVPWVLAKSGFKDTTETKGCNDPGSKSSYTLPNLDSTVSRSHGHGLVPFIGIDITEPPMTREPPSASKPGLHHYNSTPEVRAGMVPRPPSSQLRSSKLKGKLGMPMRVRNPLQQHAVSQLSGETEDDTELSGSFRPLAPLSSSASGLFRSMSTNSGSNSDLILSQEDSNVTSQPVLSSKGEGNATERKQLSDTARKKYPATDHPVTGEINPLLSVITEMETPNCSASKGNKLCEDVMKSTVSLQAVPGHSNTSSIHHFKCVLQPEVSGMQENGVKQQIEQMDTGRRLEEIDQRASSVVVHSKAAASSEVQASAASWHGANPVMSTPSCKSQRSQDFPATVFQTPKPDFIQNVVVNGEHYCILKKVGRGGSAQVFMVFDSQKNVRALKVVDLEGAGEEVIDGYRNEISLLQRLQYCDSVIKMYNFEYNEQLNRLYVVLEFGETDLAGFFATRAKQHCGMDPTTIKFYWKEMLRAVHALHQEGIIHSDLKPANFMLVAGNLKLIDFGIANALQQDKTSVLKDTRVGTPSYMSPEAIMAACDDGADDSFSDKENVDKNARPKYKIGKRSDVWSLGCILYNMVYGRTPFQHIKNNLGKLQAITNPKYVIKFPPVPDPHLLDVLQKCLIRDVKSRLTTEELLVHPYLTSDKDSTTKVPTDKDNEHTPSNISHTPEPLRLKEQLKTHVAHGCSPATKAVIMNLLQKLDKTGS